MQQLHDNGKSEGQSAVSPFSCPNLRSLCYTPSELIVNLPRQATQWAVINPKQPNSQLQVSEEHQLTAVARPRIKVGRWKVRTAVNSCPLLETPPSGEQEHSLRGMGSPLCKAKNSICTYGPTVPPPVLLAVQLPSRPCHSTVQLVPMPSPSSALFPAG